MRNVAQQRKERGKRRDFFKMSQSYIEDLIETAENKNNSLQQREMCLISAQSQLLCLEKDIKQLIEEVKKEKSK